MVSERETSGDADLAPQGLSQSAWKWETCLRGGEETWGVI